MPENKTLQSLQELIEIMSLLRSPNGCQWDKQQTAQTLKKHILEEAYELLEAIDQGSTEEICDELGDLLLQVVFQAQIFSELGHFTLSEVAQSISNKLKRRHPHIFADASHEGHEQRWEEIKRQERSDRGQKNTLEHRIPKTLPALKRATKVAKKCPVDEPHHSIQKIELELAEIKQTLFNHNYMRSDLEEQLGNLLFNLCKFSATTDCDLEDILRKKTTQLVTEIDSQIDVY